jgi:hypothetical protein
MHIIHGQGIYACGALLFSFFLLPISFHSSGSPQSAGQAGRPQKKKQKKGISDSNRDGLPINIQPPISLHLSGQADIGEAAMWFFAARCTQHYSFDFGQQCPVTQEFIYLAIGMEDIVSWYSFD